MSCDPPRKWSESLCRWLAALVDVARSGRALLWGVTAIALAALAGWILGLPRLTSWAPALATLKPMTALCFLALVLALRAADAGRVTVTAWLVSTVVLIGALGLFQDVTAVDLKIDTWLASRIARPGQADGSWRMASATALMFMAAGPAVAWLKDERRDWLVPLFAGAVGLLALGELVMLAVDSASFYLMPRFSSVALPTMVAFLLLSGELLRRRPLDLDAIGRKAGVKLGIAAWLLSLVLAATLPLVLFAGYAAQRLTQSERRATLIELERRSEAAANVVERYLRSTVELAVTLANAPAALHQELPAFHAFAAQAVAAGRTGRNVAVVEPDGRQLLNTRRPFGEALPPYGDPEGLAEVVASKSPHISNLFIGRVASLPTFAGATPVVRDGEVTSVIAVGVEPQDLTAALRDEWLPEGWIAVVIDRRGTIVARTHDPEAWVGQTAMPELIAARAKGRRGAYPVVTKEGVPFTAYFVKLPDDWTVAVGVPASQLQALADRSLRFTLALSLVALSAAAALAFPVGRHMRRQVARVADAALDVGEGREPAAEPVTVRELETVAGSLAKGRRLIKHREQALRESEARFRKIFEHAVTGIAITDWAGRFVQANPAYCRLLGYTEAEFRRIDFASLICPDDREKNLAKVNRLQAGELPFFEIENRYLRKDGQAVWVHKFVSTLPDETGTPALLIALVSDISERKRAEEALRESKARLSTILDTAADAIVVIDDAGIIQSVNPAVRNTFGYTPDELVGQNVKILMPDAYARAHDSNIEAYIRTGVRKIIGIGREVEGRHKDGSTFPIDLAVAEWYDARGRRFFTGIMRDISERKRAEEALARARRLETVGRLAGGIAHDFNNLLSVITGNLELAEPQIEHEKTRQLVRRALEAAQVGGTFNRRLLSIARKRELAPQCLILNGRVAETIELLKHTLGEHIVVVTDLAPELWPTCADPGEIDSAILNLAVNARDAMPRGGEITIKTCNVTLDARAPRIDPDAHTGDYVRLSVADTGVGMPQNVLQRATEPFFTTKQPGTGTGLGLSSVFDFAKQSGGFVTLASAINKGTTVSLYLPRAAPQPASRAPDFSRDVLPGGDGELILVVEDNDGVREIALKRLEALGYAVLEARTGPEAIQILESGEPIALVLSDIILPAGMTGHDLARRILSTAPRVKVLLMSGYDQADAGRDGSGALSNIKLLRKPHTLAQLARCLRETLET